AIWSQTPDDFWPYIMLVGSAVCYQATSIDLLMMGRVIQGVGAGACAALWRTVFRDLFKGEDLSRYGSYLMILVMFIVPAAPVLGGYLQGNFGWSSNFAFMMLYAFFALILFVTVFDETLDPGHRKSLTLKSIGTAYGTLLKSPDFLTGSLCMFLSYGAFFAWFTVGPILFIEKARVSPINFGWFTFLGCGTSYALAGWLNARWVKKLGVTGMLKLGWSLMLLSSLLLYSGYAFFGVTPIAIGAPISLFYFGSTFIWPNTYAMAFTPFGSIAGYVGALYGFMQLAGAGCVSYIVSYLPAADQRPLSLVMGASALLAWAIFAILMKERQNSAPEAHTSSLAEN
ncbi:MAG: MFS transporter, partial [Alphaproteobacteria bacterium]|nr:MFS transporter [Alphaproteobacteria bacterium]